MILTRSHAEFEGGYEALLKYLQKNIKYPSIAKENQIEGKGSTPILW
ncbi:MAG: hypothetical protein IPH96_04565 [Saprospiraceae bacterium]|nr:hypothetical protein [Saprospiraceae bacterium]